MKIDKKRFSDSLFISVLIVNFLFMVIFASGYIQFSQPSGIVNEYSEELYGKKVSYTIAEADSIGPPYYVKMWILIVINIFITAIFLGFVYFFKGYANKKNDKT